MTQLTDNLFAVKVPEEAVSIEICNYGRNDTLEYMHLIDGIAAYNIEDLPPGSYEFMFTSESASEEDARKVVEKDNRGYKHYWEDKGHVPRGFNSRYKTSVESLASLLRSKHLEGNHAIIKKRIERL